MDDLNDYPEELDEISEKITEGINMEEFVANFTKLASEFVATQSQKPIGIQVIVCLVFLLIPVSLLLFCFCKILSSQNKRQGKDKKKQKEQKKETKKKA